MTQIKEILAGRFLTFVGALALVLSMQLHAGAAVTRVVNTVTVTADGQDPKSVIFTTQVVSATGPIPPLGLLPTVLGVGIRPTILDLSVGLGPVMVTCLTDSVRSILGSGFSFLGQLSDGSASYGDGVSTVTFYPLAASTDVIHLIQTRGIQLLGNNFLNISTSCGNFNVAPALSKLAEFGSVLNKAGGLIVHINGRGVLTVDVNGTIYAFRPDYLTRPGVGTGSPSLVMGTDGLFRFTDSAGNVQVLYPAFADPDVLTVQIAQAVRGTTLIQTDGTALLTLFDGQKFVLTPDLILGDVPSQFGAALWWQEGANRYRYRIGFTVASQGFTVKPQ